MEAFLEQMWLLGVPAARLSPVGQAGAAARSGRWRVDPRSAHAVAERFRRRHGDGMTIRVADRPTHALATVDQQAPASLLVRPGGAVLIDSLHPFAFGSATRDGVAACWERIRAGWRDPRIVAWARGIHSAGTMHRAELIPYRDEEVDLFGDEDAPAAPTADAPRLPRAAAPRPGGGPEEAGARVRELALGRRYRLAPIRFATESDGGRYVRMVDASRVLRLNGTAAAVMDACDGGSTGDAVARLTASFPEQPRGRLEQDVLGTVRYLQGRGLLRPALAPAGAWAPDPGGAALDLVDL
jgi:hypothetical protein